jgi:hypothetical protein
MINSKWGVSQTYRSRFTTQLPKVNTGAKSDLESWGFGACAIVLSGPCGRLKAATGSWKGKSGIDFQLVWLSV